jgi:hypothetical protein
MASHPVQAVHLILDPSSTLDRKNRLYVMGTVHQYVPGIQLVMMTYTRRFLLIRNTSIHCDKKCISLPKMA